jgi:hypothetical protein
MIRFFLAFSSYSHLNFTRYFSQYLPEEMLLPFSDAARKVRVPKDGVINREWVARLKSMDYPWDKKIPPLLEG